MSDSVTPLNAACQTSLSFTVSQTLLRLMFTESVVLSKHLILCRPLLLLPSIRSLRDKVTYRCSHLSTNESIFLMASPLLPSNDFHCYGIIWSQNSGKPQRRRSPTLNNLNLAHYHEWSVVTDVFWKISNDRASFDIRSTITLLLLLTK